jgi:hypothetical protein
VLGPSGVPGLRYPGAACDKRIGAGTEISIAGHRHEKVDVPRQDRRRIRVFRKRPVYEGAFRKKLERCRA